MKRLVQHEFREVMSVRVKQAKYRKGIR